MPPQIDIPRLTVKGQWRFHSPMEAASRITAENASPLLLEDIDRRSREPITAVTLRQLYEYARHGDNDVMLAGAQYLHREMPIRLARKVKELESVPGLLAKSDSIQIVRDWYIQSFADMTYFPEPKHRADDVKFCAMIEHIKDRHRTQVSVMARGIRDILKKEGEGALGGEVQGFLDSFYLSRIGIRVLLGHHIAAHHAPEGWVGLINPQTSVYEVAAEAADNAAALCRWTYGDPPEVKFHGRLNLRFKYVPSHLHHMLFELFKNSFRATIDNHAKSDKLPRVHVVIAGGMEDVSIKITDQGGGIPRSAMDRIWSYTYTTADETELPRGESGDVLAGLGYGLPICRLYARYFGGDLALISLEGFGTDSFLHLSRLGTHDEYIL